MATLCGLWGFAFADPVLGSVGPEPAFFTSHGVSGWPVLFWLAAICIGPPLLLMLIVLGLARAHPPLGSIALLVFGSLLFSLTVVPRIDEVLPLLLPEFFVSMAVCALFFSLGYVQWAGMRRVLSATWFSPAVFGALFLLFSPVSRLFIPASPPEFPRVGQSQPLIMIVLDEFPVAAIMNGDLEIDAERFPGFARLADLSTWYRDATTSSVLTEVSLPSLLSGHEPLAGSVPPSGDSLRRNVFSMLGASNALYVAEPIVRLCRFAECEQLDDGESEPLFRDTALVALREWAPEAWALGRLAFMQEGWKFDDGGEEIELLQEVVRVASRPAPRPPFVYAHVLLPHRPWRLLPGGYEYPVGRGPSGMTHGDSRWHSDEQVREFMRQRLLLQLQAVDTAIGDIASALAEKRIPADTMVVVAADHGLSFEPGEHFRGAYLKPGQFADIARVPLFVRYPNQGERRVVDRPATLLDVVPTIADVMDVELSSRWSFAGRSLRSGDIEIGRRRRTFGVARTAIELPGRIDMRAAVDRYRALPVRAPGSSSAFALGPLGSLMSRSWSDLELDKRPVRGSLAYSVDYRALGPGPKVPALIQVSLSQNPSHQWAVVAVNGRVSGTGIVYEHEGRARIAVLVDPTSFRRGLNEIRVAVGSLPDEPLVPVEFRP